MLPLFGQLFLPPPPAPYPRMPGPLRSSPNVKKIALSGYLEAKASNDAVTVKGIYQRCFD